MRFYYHEAIPYGDRVHEIVFGELNQDANEQEPEYCMSMCWCKLRIGERPAPRLEMFYDTFWAFDSLSDLFRALAAQDRRLPLSPDDFVIIVRTLGFRELDFSRFPTEAIIKQYYQLLQEAGKS